MAPKAAKTEETVAELSPEAIAAREAVRNVPRQSHVRFAQHYLVIRDTQPERIDEFFGGQVEALEAFIEEHGDLLVNPIEEAVAKATAKQTEQSLKALENENALTGYAGFVFDKDIADKKITPTTPRSTKSKVEKVSEILAGGISDEDAETLKTLLAQLGL